MRTIEGVAKITQDDTLVLNVPPGFAPGDYEVVVTVKEKPHVTQELTRQIPEQEKPFNKYLHGILQEPPLPGMMQRSHEEVLAQLT
jgi:hypothetical protein